jgi:hypothetical protein
MAAGAPEKLGSRDAIKTYRYLRVAMVGAVLLLAASIAIERSKVDCWQTSISAYYYTPVRAIFVGGLMVIGFALIVIKGRGPFEDICLNFAGMFAPVVAVVPTGYVDDSAKTADALTEEAFRCRPSQPLPRAVDGGTPGDVILATVDNNFHALLIAGLVGLVVAVAIAVLVNRGVMGALETVEKGTPFSLVGTGALLVVGWILIRYWDDFSTGAHTPAAALMFILLIGAVFGKARQHRNKPTKTYFFWYMLIGTSMLFGGIAIVLLRSWLFGDHTVFALEAWEIGLFATFWIIQTAENWDEEVVPTAA